MSVDFSLKFDGSFVRAFPGLPPQLPIRSQQTPNVLYGRVHPTPVAGPKILLWSNDVAQVLGLPDREGIESQATLKKYLTQVFSGNALMPGMNPIATRYGGHQFGNWAGQLGDGRAISLGEILNAKNERWEIQLKGAGPTPYSRHADGRAVLRSSLREYLCSEAMHHLGIPTTRALCCVLTGDEVIRDMFYDGNPEAEPGAITTRVAASFLRFGHFEILAASGELDLLRRLLEYTISYHFPELVPEDKKINDECILAWFGVLASRTAHLMTEWLRVGFVHGVMNTDNLSILGLTIDYGPYGWLDVYDPTWTPNTTDAQGRRYRYEQQPAIALWNLTRLAEALTTVITDSAGLQAGLELFRRDFATSYRTMRLRKLGLSDFGSPDDTALIESLDEMLTATEIDMTIFYRKLSTIVTMSDDDMANLQMLDGFLQDFCYASPLPASARGKILSWLRLYYARIRKEPRADTQIVQEMNLTNPYFILRNYLVQEALDEWAAGSAHKLNQIVSALSTPYVETKTTSPFFAKRPEWARHRAGCSALSCSS